MNQEDLIVTVNNLLAYGFSYVDFTEVDLLADVLNGWEGFTKEGQFYKELWGVELDNSSKTLGYSTVCRQDQDIEIFTERKLLRVLVENSGLDFDDHKKWFGDMEVLRSLCAGYCLDVSKVLCEVLKKDFSVLRKILSEDNDHCLQFAKYPHHSFDWLVKPHKDSSFITMQLFDNSSSFMFGTKCNAPYIVRTGKALIFFGGKAEYFSEKISAMSHSIKNDSPGESLSVDFLLSSALP